MNKLIPMKIPETLVSHDSPHDLAWFEVDGFAGSVSVIDIGCLRGIGVVQDCVFTAFRISVDFAVDIVCVPDVIIIFLVGSVI